MNKTTLDLTARGRTYIERLRRDPRTKAMHDGWIAQATMEAELRFPDPYDGRRMAQCAADRALELAMSFILDNDGELNFVNEQLERTLKASIDLANITPPAPMIIRTENSPNE